MSMRYNAVFEWNMTPEEAAVFKLGCIWEEQTQKFFPKHQGLARYPRKGDPRKCSLFRECWKLARSTRGLLQPEQYSLYIIANLQILRAQKGMVSPNALSGDKAWIRWIVWKKLYEQKKKNVAGRQEEISEVLNPVVVKELALTKKFLFEKCDGCPTAEKILNFTKGPQIRTWIQAGKVSKYYAVLSPWVADFGDRDKLEAHLQFDFELIETRSPESVRKYFEQEFAYEFKNISSES